MKNKFFVMGILVMALVFGMMVGCGGDSGGDGNGDPIKVNLSLPAIKDVASFEGQFVSSDNEAQGLVVDAVESMQEFFSSMDSSGSILPPPRSSMSMSRSVQSEPLFEEIIFDHEQIADGIYLTGFMNGYIKMSVANDNNPGGTVGDNGELSMKVKARMDFTNVQQESCTFNGSYTYDENLYQKYKVTSINPDRMSITLKYNAANGYALSVSKNGKGLKFVMKWQAKLDKTFSNEESLDDFYGDDIYDMFNYFIFTIDVYDNNNVKQNDYSKTFNNFDDVNEYLGFRIVDL